MYREIFQTDLSEFHLTVWEKSRKVSTKYILLCCMAIIAIFLKRICLKNSRRVVIRVSGKEVACVGIYKVSRLGRKFDKPQFSYYTERILW